MDVKLVMFKPDGQRKDFAITQATTVIGRAKTCDLRVPIVDVSRKHCELIKGDEEVRVHDLGSSNGTRVNNQRITDQVLKAGDRLMVGPKVFTVQIDGRPKEIAPVEAAAAGRGKAKAPARDEVVELEADLIPADEEDSAISALEALAAEQEELEEEK